MTTDRDRKPKPGPSSEGDNGAPQSDETQRYTLEPVLLLDDVHRLKAFADPLR